MATPVPAHWRPVLHAVVLAVVAFVLIVATYWLAIDRIELNVAHLSDDIVAALIIAILVFLYERRRSRDLAEKLNTIKLMNHHIRNALQVIVYSAPSAERAAESIGAAVARIDWALREVLPGSTGVTPNIPSPTSNVEVELPDVTQLPKNSTAQERRFKGER